MTSWAHYPHYGSNRTQHIVEHAASAISNSVSTPAYLFIPSNLRPAIDCLRQGIAQWGKGYIAYSLKTNPFWKLIRTIRELGCMIEVVSEWEHKLAIRSGFSPQDIIVNGPCKTLESIAFSIKNGVRSMNIDSLDELDTVLTCIASSNQKLNVGLRLCHSLSDASASRFGLQNISGELATAIEIVRRSNNLTLRCIHFHAGTQITHLKPYFDMITQSEEVWKEYELSEDVLLSIGGGFPFQHNLPLDMQPFIPERFFSDLRYSWTHQCVPSLVIEPGRWICASSFAVLSRVLSRRMRVGEPHICVLDTGVHQNMMAAFYEHSWSFSDFDNEPTRYRFVGASCIEDDILSQEIDGCLPKKGSLAITWNAGAYSLSLGRAFIQPRPPVVEVLLDGTHSVLTPRETCSSFYALFRPPDTGSGADVRNGNTTGQEPYVC